MATTTLIMPSFTMLRYTCMQPPAEVEPANISQGEQSASSMAMFRISAARAVFEDRFQA